jgi:hypothetical protein
MNYRDQHVFDFGWPCGFTMREDQKTSFARIAGSAPPRATILPRQDSLRLCSRCPNKQRRPQWSRADFRCMTVARRRYIWLSANSDPTRDCYAINLALTRRRKRRQVHFESLLHSYAGLGLFIAQRYRRPPRSDKQVVFAFRPDALLSSSIYHDMYHILYAQQTDRHGYTKNLLGRRTLDS